MSSKWIKIWMIFIGVAILFLSQPSSVHAQELTPDNDENCVACHEHQYYTYDNGKWFCLCDAPMHCVYCHGGRTDSLEKEVAHEGLVLYPTHNHAERCQTCHTEDYMSRVVTFETIAGVVSTPRPIVTATPVNSITPAESQSTPPLTRLGALDPLQLAELSVIAVAMMGLVILGYRCWKADRLLNTES